MSNVIGIMAGIGLGTYIACLGLMVITKVGR